MPSKFEQIACFFQVLYVHSRYQKRYVMEGTITLLHYIWYGHCYSSLEMLD